MRTCSPRHGKLYIAITIVIFAETASFRSYGRRHLLASNATNCSSATKYRYQRNPRNVGMKLSYIRDFNPLGADHVNLIKYTHAALVTRILESAAARCSLSAAEFRNRDSVVLFTDRHGKDAKMCVLLLTTAIYIICYAFAASAVIFYFVYVPLFLGKAGLYLSHRNGAFETNVIAGRIIAFRKDV